MNGRAWSHAADWIRVPSVLCSEGWAERGATRGVIRASRSHEKNHVTRLGTTINQFNTPSGLKQKRTPASELMLSDAAILSIFCDNCACNLVCECLECSIGWGPGKKNLLSYINCGTGYAIIYSILSLFNYLIASLFKRLPCDFKLCKIILGFGFQELNILIRRRPAFFRI